jgi:integrase
MAVLESGSSAQTVSYDSGSRFGSGSAPLVSTLERFQAALDTPLRLPITTGEFTALMDAAQTSQVDQNVRDLSLIVYCTGIRPEELLTLRWSQVDIAKRELYVYGDRKHPDRLIPFADRVATTLDAWLQREPDAVYVLGANPGAVLDTVSDRLKLLSMQVLRRPISLYTMRLAFLMRWKSVGGNLGQLALITGISPVRVKHAGLSTEPLYAAAAKFQAWLESLV